MAKNIGLDTYQVRTAPKVDTNEEAIGQAMFGQLAQAGKAAETYMAGQHKQEMADVAAIQKEDQAEAKRQEKEAQAKQREAEKAAAKAERDKERAERKAEQERLRAERKAEQAALRAERKKEQEQLRAERKAEREQNKAERLADRDEQRRLAEERRQQAKEERDRLRSEREAYRDARRAEQEERRAERERQRLEKEEMKNMTAEEKARMKEEKAAQDQQNARDKIIAKDRLGDVQREYIRAKQQLDQTYTGDPQSREYEKQKKELFKQMVEDSSQDLTPKARQEMISIGNDWINASLTSDLKNSYIQEQKDAEKALKETKKRAKELAKEAGQTGDIEAAKANFEDTKNTIKDYADSMGIDDGLIEHEEQYYTDMLQSYAESYPEEAEIATNPENIANFVGQDYEKNKGYFDAFSDRLKKDMAPAIERGKAIREDVARREANEQKIMDTLDFLGHPVFEEFDINEENMSDYIGTGGAGEGNYIDFYKNVKEYKKKIYENSAKIGTGDVTPQDFLHIARMAGSITLNPDGTPDNNLLKAFDTYAYLQEHGANQAQLNTFTKFINRALTDQNFKRGIASWANKPSFDTMFSQSSGIFRKSKQKENEEFVNQQSKRANEAFMQLAAEGKYTEAMKDYNDILQETYDTIKSDIIDIDYVKENLEKSGMAVIPLNGNMTKIIGRGPNGEFLVEHKANS